MLHSYLLCLVHFKVSKQSLWNEPKAHSLCVCHPCCLSTPLLSVCARVCRAAANLASACVRPCCLPNPSSPIPWATFSMQGEGCYGFGLCEPVVCVWVSQCVWGEMQGASFWAERLQVPTLSVSKAIILNIVVFCVCPLILMLCIVVKLVSLGHSGNTGTRSKNL